MKLLINQVGYSLNSPKQGVLLSTYDLPLQTFDSADVLIVEVSTGQTLARVPLQSGSKVDQWNVGWCYQFDFSAVKKTGRFVAQFQNCTSYEFEIEPQLLYKRTFSDLLHYFKSQRCGGIFDQADQQARLLNSDTRVDVSGGWYDASGDVSKYLSHLSYANFFNPQQIPMVVWNLLKSLELLKSKPECHAFTQIRIIEEALFGADFLVRMQSPDGFFYMTVFDKWSKDPAQRDICAYETQLGQKGDDYQAGFRQGAGVAIAALASAARVQLNDMSQYGEFDNATYLQSAETGYWHLKQHNLAYLNDGVENIIDEYCALLAAVELFKTTSQPRYLDESREWATRLIARQQQDSNFQHFWAATSDGSRPYFHASDSGLPLIALCQYLDIETDQDKTHTVHQVINNAVEFELAITQKVANPFGYPRQYVKDIDGDKRDAFFIAQNNESGYWWQGENARLASLSTMSYLAMPYLSKSLQQRVTSYTQNALNWVLGLNPYDMCMLDGHGLNNPDYLPELGFFNAKGGICNGITAGFDDPSGIAFNPAPYADDMVQNWRWGEQWIPHGAWFLLAVASQAHHEITAKTTA